jgi:vitamin B12 transporter
MKKLILLILIILTASSARAEDKDPNPMKKLLQTAVSPIETIIGPATELDRIVVTPSRVEERLVSSSCSVSVVDEQDFNRQKVDAVKNALQEQVGLDVVQAGSFQGQTSLFTRGSNSNQTLILIDGVKAYDPISPNGAYNLANLTLDNVESIEIVRGPQSVLYGADAMAGVVSIISKRADKPYVTAEFSGGSFYTYDERVEVGAQTHGFHYSISASRLDTKGISQAQAKQNNQERDPYDRTSVATRIDYDIADVATIGATFRYLEAHYAIDQGANQDDDNAFVTSTDNFFTLYGTHRWTEWWEHSLKLGWMETKRLTIDDDSPGFGGFDFGRRKDFGKYFKIDYQSIFDIQKIDKIVAGYSYTEELGDYYSQYKDWLGAMVVDDMPKVFSREGDFYLENRFNYADRLTSTQGMRVGHHSQAGTFETYRIDASYLFATGTKVRGLVATGFRAPSLYQLYAQFVPPVFGFGGIGGGNPALQPEKSSSYEYGLDQYLFGEKMVAGVTYFHAVYRNLIDAPYDPTTGSFGQYVNIGKSQAHGIEATLRLKPIDSLRIESGFTFLKAWDFSNDQEMPRRPGRKFYVECFWQATEKLSGDLTVRYNGPRSDNLNTFVNTYKVKEYTVVDMVINYDISKTFSVYGKIDNLFNKYYEEVRGYTMAPFSAYGGVKAKF